MEAFLSVSLLLPKAGNPWASSWLSRIVPEGAKKAQGAKNHKIYGGYDMTRDLFFALFALALTVAVVAWLEDGPRLDVRTIEASATK